MDVNNPHDLAHWTAFVFALRLLYRKSSIAPTSLASFDFRTGLSREKVVSQNNVVLVYQNHSKTNQFMSSTRIIPLINSQIRALDPVWHWSKLVTENVAPPNYPAFTYLAKGYFKCVTHNSFTNYLKKLLNAIRAFSSFWEALCHGNPGGP